MNTEFQSEQMAEMARLYYMEGRNQTEIGERFGISRFKVAQYIQEAARRGIVEIKIHTPVKRDGGLEKELRERLGMKHAVVIDNSRLTHEETLAGLGKAGAGLVKSLLEPGMTLGENDSHDSRQNGSRQNAAGSYRLADGKRRFDESGA